MIRVAIIDDHYVVRVGLKTIIDMDDELEFAGEASSGEGAAAFVVMTKPDVLLLDIRMPGRDGIETLESILTVKPSQKVVMLTTSDADDEVYRALNKGARGYLLKDRDSDAICKAVKTVYAGGKFIPEAVREIYRRRQMMSDLTPRERDVLELVAGGRVLAGIKTNAVLRLGHELPDRVVVGAGGERRFCAKGLLAQWGDGRLRKHANRHRLLLRPRLART